MAIRGWRTSGQSDHRGNRQSEHHTRGERERREKREEKSNKKQPVRVAEIEHQKDEKIREAKGIIVLVRRAGCSAERFKKSPVHWNEGASGHRSSELSQRDSATRPRKCADSQENPSPRPRTHEKGFPPDSADLCHM